jgi:putative membrane protein
MPILSVCREASRAMSRWSVFALATLLLWSAALPAARAQDGRISDAQIVGVLMAANQAEIAAGQLALRRSQSRSVQVFASRIVAEHRQIDQEANDMLRRLGANAQRSGLSDAIQRQSQNDLTALDDNDMYSFDRAYLNREVNFLGQLIQSVDGYIRTTTSADVKILLVRARPALTFHLDQARQIQYALDRPGFGR